MHKATNSARPDVDAIFTFEHTGHFFHAEPLFKITVHTENVRFQNFVFFGTIRLAGRKMFVVSAAVYSETSAQSFNFVLTGVNMAIAFFNMRFSSSSLEDAFALLLPVLPSKFRRLQS